jgi:DNA-binding GntR family transcriptional regulator
MFSCRQPGAFIMPSRPLRRHVLSGSLADQVYRSLRADIIHGRYRAGDKLVELELAQRVGTSQGTVREALQRLEREGLVERHMHRATYVTPLDSEAIHELFVIRSTIEGIAMRRAMQYLTLEDLARLDHLLAAMQESADRQDIAALVEYDLEFHRIICQISRSSVLVNTWQPLYSQIQRFIVQTHPQYFRDLHSLADTHIVVLDAMRAGNVEAAVQVLQEHVMLIWTWINTNSAEGNTAG